MNPAEVKKILIIKLRGLGDIILSSLAFNSIKEFFPNAEIDFLTEKPGDQILSPLPFINQIHLINRKSTLKKLSSYFKVRFQHYDLVIDFHSNPTTAQLTYFSGAKYRAGFPYRGRKFAYNLFGPAERDKFHSADLHLEFIKQIGIKPATENRLYFGLTPKDIQFAENFKKENIESGKLLIGISPTGGWQSKKAPHTVFVKIIEALLNKYDAKILILWGPGDEEDTQNILSNFNNRVIKAPNTTIRELGALISVCDFVVANDSGPMHIASAVDTPVLGLFGPTAPKFQGPYGSKNLFIRKDDLHCIECNLLDCKYNQECFTQLPLDEITAQFDNLVKLNSNPKS